MLDEVVVALYKSPKSYTGEDVVEISCHGSAHVLHQVIMACVENGARPALPGEFTQRAFLNGKMDLTQAEAVADLIAADSEAARLSALKQLRGGFSHDLAQLRDELLHFAALIELELDFSQEDVAFADREALYALINTLAHKTDRLIDSFRLGNVIKNGVPVTIAGKPNAGKSTLLNALLNEERAIVSDIAGTTRDTIEETLTIKGLLFRFNDTAGIREDTKDAIEQIGIRKAYEKIAASSILVYLADASSAKVGEVAAAAKELVKDGTTEPFIVFTKADLLDAEQLSSLQHSCKEVSLPVLILSVKEEQAGVHTVEDLKEKLYQLVMAKGSGTGDSVVTNTRHLNALRKVRDSLLAIRTGMDSQLSGDLLAPDIRRCLHYLGEITGQVEVDRDILGTIFGKFCIGK